MKTSPVGFEDLANSVVAVPPLARDAALRIERAENRKIIHHLERGGVTTLMYGGNANFYNIPLSEYRETLEFFTEAAGEDSWVIPSAGPDYGRLVDQAAVLREMAFPTAMVLPLGFPATPAGVEAGIRRFAELFGRPVVAYVKSEGYLEPEQIARLVDDGLVCAIKYAIVHPDPGKDEYLERLVRVVDRRLILSGIGERPAITHIRDFDLAGFTSGSVCVAPRLSSALLRAMRDERWGEARNIRERFLPFEDLRDALSPIRVLHHAVALAGIAETGPLLPLLSDLPRSEQEAVRSAAVALYAADGAPGTVAAFDAAG